MQTSLRRTLGATALSSVLLPGLPTNHTATSDALLAPDVPAMSRSVLDTQLPIEDVTADHPDLVATLVASAAEQGVHMDPTTLRVVRPLSNPDDLHILPERAHLVAAAGDRVEVAVQPNPISRWARQPQSAVRSGSYWKLTGSDCFGRWRHDGTYIDACWRESVFIGDGDTKRTWFALQYWATAGPDTKLLESAALRAKSSNANAAWSDWSPRSDSTGNCRTTSVSVSLLGLGVGESYDRCETWDITKFASPQDGIRNKYSWDGGGILKGSPHDREVALAMSVAIPQSDTNQGWVLIRGLEGTS